MRRFRAGLFDSDGTLLDSRDLLYLAASSIFANFGLPPPTKEMYFSGVGADYEKFYKAHGIPKDASKETMNRIRREFILKNWGLASLFEDVIPTLRYLKNMGLKIGIISAENSGILERRVKENGLDKLLDYCAGSVCDKKTLVLDALDKFRMDPEECFFVEDTPKDIVNVKESGAIVIGVTHGFGTPEEIGAVNPHKVISAISELVPFIESDY